MAFGFNDFAKFFDPISDVLGTSGKRGVGLLQQEPEDLRTAAMIAALVASGGSAAGLFGPGAAAGTAAAGVPATLVTPTATGILAAAPEAAAVVAPEVASLGVEGATRLAAEETARIAAKEAAQQSIVQANQLPSNLLSDVGAEGIKTAYRGDNFLEALGDKGPLEKIAAPYGRNKGVIDYFTGEAGAPNIMEPAIDTLGNTTIDIPTNSAVDNYLQNRSFFNEPPVDIGSQDVGIREMAGRMNPATDFQSGLNYTKPPVPGVGSNVSYNLTGGDTFRTYGDTDLSASLPKSQAGLSNPTANIGNRIPTIQGDYTQTESALDKGMRLAEKYFDKAATFAKDYPYPAAGLAYYTAYKTGMLDQKPVEAPADDYKNPYTMTGFRRSSPAPDAYRYAPRYAEGGIASVQGYKKGGRSKTEAAMDFYDAMNPRQESAPLSHGSPGIYYDTDPDTRYLDPMEAAMVRMSKLNSRANVQAPTMTPSRRMGELDFEPVAAAQGGIMGYADGGAPLEDDMYIRLTGRNDRASDRMPEPDVPFSPTSEGAAAVSKFGQGLKDYPAIAPGGIAAQVIGSIASAYGDHMARNVDPNYSNEGRQQMQAAQSAAQDARIASFDAGRTHEGGGGGQGPSVSSSNFGGGSFDPGGRDSDGTPLAKGGGIMGYNLGGYAAGGNPRLLRGPGDGMSDNIPATINNRQPARLADGEYVITADVVSHLGNGSTEAGAKQLDAMMKRIRKGRTGTSKQGKQINPRKYLPA